MSEEVDHRVLQYYDLEKRVGKYVESFNPCKPSGARTESYGRPNVAKLIGSLH
jgi:hypothetical protein